ncbi:fimbrial protein [Escherichia marmotae]|nr:fimbrial protein [Escherichia marmotae]
MNKKLLAVVLAASCFSAGNAMAVDGGEININGLVSDETCPATVNGGSNDVNITLKTAKPSDIAALNDKALGAYPAAISISVNCSNAAANKTATMSFTSTFHSSTQGTLENDNSISGPAKGVNIALHDVSATTPALVKVCNFAFFSGLIDAQFWMAQECSKSPELTANYC